MSEELVDQINSELEYGDNRSAWVRDAVRLKFEVLEALEGIDKDLTDEERREFVGKVVREAAEDLDS